MIRNYPVKKPSSAPATGRLLYDHLMRNLKIPAAANHTIWYAGESQKREEPTKYAFRGDIPQGKTLELKALAGDPFEKSALYTFKGTELYVLVSDLTASAHKDLNIPKNARDKDKVFNANFKPYEKLSEITRYSNELAALSLPKSISSYLAGVRGNVNYSESDVLNFLNTSIENLSSPEMMHILHGNHLAWAALSYMREQGNVEGDLLAEFHGQNPADFYVKDLGTVLPSMYYAVANLGQNPVDFHVKLDIEIWGARSAADYMTQYLSR
ncbi:MAG TPA: hypothetical protein VJK03_04170 [Candidatus Nanoarchaeia archaeon]|nr:hypothetical protein [Candidatus Nanoarchaeia archaeon]